MLLSPVHSKYLFTGNSIEAPPITDHQPRVSPEIRAEDPPVEAVAKDLNKRRNSAQIANRPEPLISQSTPFHGVFCDFKHRLSQYKSDLRDALNLQCLAAFVCTFLPHLASSVAFGSMYGTYKTTQC